MFKFNINKIYQILIESTYLGVVFFIPIFFAISPKTYNAFELNKIVLFRILVLLLLFFIFAKLIYSGDIRKKIKYFIETRGKYLIIPLSYILGFSVLSFFSVSPENSFWGIYERQLGLYSYLYLFVFFCLLVFCVKTNKQIERILITILFSSFFVCIYGLIQALGLDPLDWIESSQGRIISTFGQPNFLASYLLLVIPLTGYLFFKTNNTVFKIFVGFSLLIQIVCMFFTYSRGGQMGLIVGSFIFLLIYLFLMGKSCWILNLKKRYYFIFILGIFFIFCLWWSSLSHLHKIRIIESADFKKGSVSSRVDYWQASWDAFKRKPFIGYGLENQKEVLAGYYKKDWAIFNNVNSIPDRAHNIFFDSLLTGGMFGLTFFLLFNAYFLKLAFGNIFNDKRKKLSLAILFSWICYSISLLFIFPVVATEVYFWLFLAILTIIHLPDDLKEEESLKPIKRDKFFFILFLKILFTLVIFVGIFYQLNKEIKIIIADHYFYKLESALVNKEYFEAYVLYEWIGELKVENSFYDRTFSDYLSQRIDGNVHEIWAEAAKKIYLPKTLDNFKNDSYKDVCTRAKAYSVIASEQRKDYYEMAEEAFSLCIQKGSGIPENYIWFAKYYVKKSDYEKAIENLNKALLSLPNIEDERFDDIHKELVRRELYSINLIFGDIYLETGDYEKAREHYYIAKNYFNGDMMVWKRIADSFYLNKDIDGAIGLLKKIKFDDDSNYFWPFLIATLEKERNNKDIAIIFANEASELSPENKDVEKILKELIQN